MNAFGLTLEEVPLWNWILFKQVDLYYGPLGEALAGEVIATLEELFGETRIVEEMNKGKENIPPGVHLRQNQKVFVLNAENQGITLDNVRAMPQNSFTSSKLNPTLNSALSQNTSLPRTPVGTRKLPASLTMPKKIYKKRDKVQAKKEQGPRKPVRRSARLVEKWIKKEE